LTGAAKVGILGDFPTHSATLIEFNDGTDLFIEFIAGGIHMDGWKHEQQVNKSRVNKSIKNETTLKVMNDKDDSNCLL